VIILDLRLDQLQRVRGPRNTEVNLRNRETNLQRGWDVHNLRMGGYSEMNPFGVRHVFTWDFTFHVRTTAKPRECQEGVGFLATTDDAAGVQPGEAKLFISRYLRDELGVITGPSHE
jgi:hypothetical protein